MEADTTALEDDNVISLLKCEGDEGDESLEMVEKERNNKKHRTAKNRVPK